MEAENGKKRGRLYIAPSVFASHFYFGCDRQLIFSASHIDRARWFYKDHGSDVWTPFERSVSIHLEMAKQNGDKEVILLDTSKADLERRLLARGELQLPILRSNWFVEESTTSNGVTVATKRPLSEENCNKLDKGYVVPHQPIDITMDGIDYVAKLNDMMLLKRNTGDSPSGGALKLSKSIYNEAPRDALGLAFTSGGDQWEAQLLEMIASRGDTVHMGTLPEGAEQRASDRKLSLAQFLQLLHARSNAPASSFAKREYIYQPGLESPEELYKHLNLNKTQVVFSKCFPDFLELSKCGDWLDITIVDAKNTDHMKLSHRIQVAIYYFIIDALLVTHNLKERVRVKMSGGVWLRQQTDYETFDLTPVLAYLREFFRQGTWKQLSETPLHKIKPQLNKKCAYCNFNDFCKPHAVASERELSLVYGISAYEKRYVYNFLESQGHIASDDIIPIERIHELLNLHARDPIALAESDDLPSVAVASESTSDVSPSDPNLPSTPSKPTPSRQPSTPSIFSTPSTPNSSQATVDYTNISPTKPEEPPSPFPLAKPSQAVVEAEPEAAPVQSVTEDHEEADLYTFALTNAPSALKPLNRPLWMSLKKTEAFLSKRPVLLNQPSNDLNDAEDIAIVISLISDRPNGHLLAWSITARSAASAVSKKMLELYALLESLQSEPLHVSRVNDDVVHVSYALSTSVVARDPLVAQLTERLILVLHDFLAHISAKLPKTSVRLFVFTPNEHELLRDLLLPIAQKAAFAPSNEPHQAYRTVTSAALRLLTTLYQSPATIALPHHPLFKNAASSLLSVLRPAMTALLALPVFFDADFDDFHRALCVPTSLDHYVPTAELHSQKGILTQWYQVQKSGEQSAIKQLPSTLHRLLSTRASMVLDMLNSVRYIVSDIKESAIVARNGSSFKSVKKESDAKPDSTLSLLCGKSRPFAWTPFIPTCHFAISKLIYASNYDMLTTTTKNMNARLSIAFRETFQMEERVIAMRLQSTYIKQRPRSTVTICVFECDYVSESLASALQQDILDAKTTRWLVCNSSAKGIAAALAFDDYRQATPALSRFKFVPPGDVAFATPVKLEFSTSGHKRLLLHLQMSAGKKMPPPTLGHTYYLSEFMVDLTSDILKSVLVNLDARLGFARALKRLHVDPSSHDIHEKQNINSFLNWLLQAAQKVTKPKETTISLPDPTYLKYFDAMGGVGAFFLEQASGADPESLPADLERAMGELAIDRVSAPAIKLKFNAIGCAVEKIGEQMVWAVEEYLGIKRAGTVVPLAILERTLEWGAAIPSDFRDHTVEMRRLEGLAELAVALEVFTPIQYAIFQQVVKQKLTCVWGPPGTGKTYFLANTILLFLEAHRTMVLKDVVITETEYKPSSAKKTARAKKTSTPAQSSTPSTADPIHDLAQSLAQDLQQRLTIDLQAASTSTSAKPAESPQASEPIKETAPEPVIVQQLVPTGAPFVVVIVAFTHRAIDNLLERFMKEDRKFRENFGVPGGEIPTLCLPVGRMFSDKKSSSFFSDATWGAHEVPEPIDSEAQLEDFVTRNPQCVIGTTVWSLRKFAKASAEINMLVVDEASQMLLAQGLIATQWLLSSSRLVVAGDHHQLPPIANAVFPDDDSVINDTIYSKSLFEYLKYHDPDMKVTQMLNENWRSNQILSLIPSATIYATSDPSRRYQPANKTIANQKFWLQADNSDVKIPGLPDLYKWVTEPTKPLVPIRHPLLQLMFDADRPFGVVLLKQTQSGGVALDSLPHAPIIACLISAVRMAAKHVFPTETDASFWKSKLLVVAPHHAQRHRIRECLVDPSPSWHVDWAPNVNLAIETVEKAQGRQYTSVIVDYGIIDNYRIAKELSFLYSRNRINVAQTRAESKCIIFVSEAMLQMNPDVYSSKSIQEGFSYLQYIVQWSRERNLVYDLPIDRIPQTLADLEQDPLFSHLEKAQ